MNDGSVEEEVRENQSIHNIINGSGPAFTTQHVNMVDPRTSGQHATFAGPIETTQYEQPYPGTKKRPRPSGLDGNTNGSIHSGIENLIYGSAQGKLSSDGDM